MTVVFVDVDSAVAAVVDADGVAAVVVAADDVASRAYQSNLL